MNVCRACLALALLVPLSAAAQERQSSDPKRERTELGDERFNAADKNHDGYLSRAETKASMPTVEAHFDKVDANHDGHISREELRDAGDRMSAKP